MNSSDSEFPGRVAPTPHSLGRPDVQAAGLGSLELAAELGASQVAGRGSEGGFQTPQVRSRTPLTARLP